MTEYRPGDAMLEAVAAEMRRDDDVFYMCTAGMRVLEEEFGPERSRRTPIAEGAVTGLALGAALAGGRPVVHLRNTCFSFSAFDQIVNQIAKVRYMSGGQCHVPLVIWLEFRNGQGLAAQHSQTAYASYGHAAGLKLIAPSNADDAAGLMVTAIRSADPVICFEATALPPQSVVDTDWLEPLPFGHASVLRPGHDVTIVAIQNTVTAALQAATELGDLGIDAEVIDPRTLVPLDMQAIRDSVDRTGRLIVADESHPVCSFASEIISSVLEDRDTFGCLDAPPRRVCNAPVPLPCAPNLERAVLPSAADIVTAARQLVEREAG